MATDMHHLSRCDFAVAGSPTMHACTSPLVGTPSPLATLRTQVDGKGAVGEVIVGYTRLIDQVLDKRA